LQVLPQYQAKIQAIHKAIEQGNFRAVKLLTDRKKLALCRDGRGLAPLHKAIVFGRTDIAKYLIRSTSYFKYPIFSFTTVFVSLKYLREFEKCTMFFIPLRLPAIGECHGSEQTDPAPLQRCPQGRRTHLQSPYPVNVICG